MKKFLMIFLFMGALFAGERYPIIFEYNFLNGCISGVGDKFTQKQKENYCICALKALENKYSASEIIDKLSDPDAKKEIVQYAAQKCISNLIK